MTCCGHCRDAGDFFDDRTARRELKKYKWLGPEKSTRLLISAVTAVSADEKTLLDIGGGIGAIQFELFNKGLNHSTNVDASRAYQSVSSREAEDRGLAENTEYLFGDYTEIAPSLPTFDIVTLDKVVCCYPDKEALLSSSVEKATALYGLVFPRENIIMKIAFRIINTWFRIRGSEFRIFLHPYAEVDAIIRSYGFRQKFFERTFLWRILLYEKQ